MKVLWILLLLALAGCSASSVRSKVEAYGIDRFRDDVLSAIDGHALPPNITSHFLVLRSEPYLNGVVLVFEESDRYRSGIYVDSESLDGWSGSGFELEPWAKQIGWFTEKKRKPAS